jgi:hypothetical protein
MGTVLVSAFVLFLRGPQSRKQTGARTGSVPSHDLAAQQTARPGVRLAKPTRNSPSVPPNAQS